MVSNSRNSFFYLRGAATYWQRSELQYEISVCVGVSQHSLLRNLQSMFPLRKGEVLPCPVYAQSGVGMAIAGAKWRFSAQKG